tara:strand:+ start:11397 stop:13085 length:1689 start_codon:yes stop_codon:yes gene_type:complete
MVSNEFDLNIKNNDNNEFDLNINNNDINNNLKSIYDLFSYNSIDQYDKLYNKNHNINDNYLYDFVNDNNRYQLQNCNFVDTDTPKLYENKILKHSNSFSARKLAALSPLDNLPKYDNNDLQNDDFNEIDIKYDYDKLKWRNMDNAYISYMSTRNADSSEGGFHDWSSPPDFSDTIYKKEDERRMKYDIQNRNSDFFNNTNLITNNKSGIPKIAKDNHNIYFNLLYSDFDFDDDKHENNTFVYNKSNIINESFTNSAKKSIAFLPNEKNLDYNQKHQQKNPINILDFKNRNDLSIKSHRNANNKEYINNTVKSNNNVDNDYIKNYIKMAIYEISQNDINEKQNDIKSNLNRSPKKIELLNFQDNDNFKFKDNINLEQIRKNPEYNTIKNAVLNYNTDIKKREIDSYEIFNNKFNTKIDKPSHNIKSNDILYKLIRNEYADLKDSKFYNHLNPYSRSPTAKSKYNEAKLSENSQKTFNYSEFINNNENSGFNNKIDNSLKNPRSNRNNVEDNVDYDESFDISADGNYLAPSGQANFLNNSNRKNTFSALNRKNTNIDTNFGTFS